MRRRRPAISGVLCALALSTTPGWAWAEDIGGVPDAPLVRKQLLLRGGRHEATAGLGVSLGDAFVRGWAPTFGYTYYLFNWFGVGADFNYNLCAALGDSCRTNLAEQIELVNPDLRSGDLDDLSVLTFMVTPYATLIPITGKLGLFGTMVVNWDVHLTLGAALVGTDNLGEGDQIQSDAALAPVIGIGQRFYLGNSLAITVSLRDYVINRVLNVPTGDDDAGAETTVEEIENRFLLTVGASFYFPPRGQTAP